MKLDSAGGVGGGVMRLSSVLAAAVTGWQHDCKYFKRAAKSTANLSVIFLLRRVGPDCRCAGDLGRLEFTFQLCPHRGGQYSCRV